MPGAGEEQQAAGGEGAGRGWARAFGRALAAGADESAAGAAGSGPGGAGRTGAGTSGLAAGGGAHAMGAASAVAGEGARGTGETEQEELVRALRASRATAGAAGERLPWSLGALSGLAGTRRQTARDRWDDPGTHGSAGALSGGVGASATLGAGFVGESAFGSGAGDRKQGGRSLPQLDGRGRGTGA